MSIEELIKITAGGLEIATFSEIRGALISKYKDVYGSDIDLSTASADGVFVNDLALIINNILQTVNVLYDNLDVRQASGIYLDTLCALSNITRKQATYSSTSLLVSESSGISRTLSADDLKFIDQAGNVWIHDSSETFTAYEIKELSVTCSQIGPVKAPAGWINETLTNVNLTVIQERDASVGTNTESDEELRSRRIQSIGASGKTVLEALSGALLNLSGIYSVKIYNNNSGIAITSKDGTTVDEHSIYVIVRRDAEDITVDDNTIGSLIHDKLTPGIHTCESAIVARSKEYDYVLSAFGVPIVDAIQEIYWKDAEAISPDIEIEIEPSAFFVASEFEQVSYRLMQYLNELDISTDLDETSIMIETVGSDPEFKGRPTYIVKSINIDDATNPDTFYNYTNYSYSIKTGLFGLNIISNGRVTVGGVTYTSVNNTFVHDTDIYEITNCRVTINDVVYPVTATRYLLTLN